MNRFYVPDVRIGMLDEPESKHAVRVLRIKTGDYIELVDGKGNYHIAEISDDHPKRCQYKVTKEWQEPKRDFYLHIAIAPTKNNERLEWFLEKATEIGVDEITPITCEHSERRVIKPERLEKIIVSAMKQSGRASLPKLNPLVSINEFLVQPFSGVKFIAHCYEEDKKQLKDSCSKSKDTLVLIGPEGDFSENEVKKALEKEFAPVSLGDYRLRTETAGVVACQTVQLVNL